jgi:AcrR family transcriptional regulator
MGRPQLHEPDAILDAARTVVSERGVRAATIGAIARASDAPTGSIYHRFGSLQELLARTWIRAVRRSQDASLLVIDGPDPTATVVAAALGTYDFCARHPADAMLLTLFRREDFTSAELPADVRGEIETINTALLDTVGDIAFRLFGSHRRIGADVVVAAAVDLPYGLARPYLQSGRRPPARRRALIPAAVHALLREAGSTAAHTNRQEVDECVR